MIELTEPPARSAIRIERRGEAAALSWPARPWARGPVAGAFDLIATVIAVIVAMLYMLGLVAIMFTRVPGVVTVVHVPIAAVFLLATWTTIRNRRRFRHREKLLLEGAALVHLPSRQSASASHAVAGSLPEQTADLSEAAKAMTRRRAYAVARKADITDVALEGKGSFGIVSVKCDGYDVDIGRRLRDADRAWLLHVLRRWRAEEAA
ncbi:MAG: hypothetical protein ACYSU0_02740 [Planctomycetota bacterium]